MKIREFVPEDLEEMRSIWNQVVEAADAFPQEKDLEAEEAYDFLKISRLPEWQKKMERLPDYIFCIPIM